MESVHSGLVLSHQTEHRYAFNDDGFNLCLKSPCSGIREDLKPGVNFDQFADGILKVSEILNRGGHLGQDPRRGDRQGRRGGRGGVG